jgi:hypothetical protein
MLSSKSCPSQPQVDTFNLLVAPLDSTLTDGINFPQNHHNDISGPLLINKLVTTCYAEWRCFRQDVRDLTQNRFNLVV